MQLRRPTEAEKVLREVEVDDSVVEMRGQFAGARRVALLSNGRVVAAGESKHGGC